MKQSNIPFLQADFLQQASTMVQSMTVEEKIAQLFGIAAWSNRDTRYEEELLAMVEQIQPGGIIFFQGTAERQLDLTQKLNDQANIPVLYSMDAEWGLSMRLDNAPGFPYNMTLGAIEDNNLIYEISSEIARHLKQLGVGMNYAPVVDINSNPDNPVISFRSFGSNPQLVIEKALAFMKGHQDQGVIAVAKHFPGHGDTAIDSHQDLPVINKSKLELEKMELLPFLKLMDAGVGGIMTGHLHLPALDPGTNRASTLSKNIVQDWLKDELSYQGLVITDALDMQAVAKYFEPGEVELQSYLAGNDVLLFTKDPVKAIEKIRQAIEQGLVQEKELDQRVIKLLQAKLWVKKHQTGANQLQHLWTENSINLNQNAAKSSITLLKDNFQLNNGDKIAVINLNLAANKGPYGALKHHDITKSTTQSGMEDLKTKIFFPLQEALPSATIEWKDASGSARLEILDDIISTQDRYDWLVVLLHGMPVKPVNHFGLDQEIKARLDQYIMSGKGILCVVGNAYVLNELKLWRRASGVVLTYQENTFVEPLISEILLRNMEAKGRIPVTFS